MSDVSDDVIKNTKAESQATKNIDKTMKEQQKAEKKKIDAEAQFNRANMFSDNAKKELDVSDRWSTLSWWC